MFFTSLIVKLTALLNSFLSLSPTIFHGLVPWIDPLNHRPVTPTPSVTPSAFSSQDRWEEIPIINLSTTENPIPSPSPSPLPLPLPLPPPASSLSFEDVDDDYQEEWTAEEPLWELWRLLKLAIRKVLTDVNCFIGKHPFLHSPPSASLSFTEESQPSIEERLHQLEAEREDQRKTIRALEQEVKDLTSEVKELRRRDLARVTTVDTTGILPQPVFSTSSTSHPPPLPQGQPVVSTGSAPCIPPVQPFDFGCRTPPSSSFDFSCSAPPPEPSPPGQPVFSTGSAPAIPPVHRAPPSRPFDFGCPAPPPPPFDFGYRAPPASSHPPFSYMCSAPPERPFGFSCPPLSQRPTRPRPFSLDDFLKDHPQAGSKKAN